MRAIAITCGVFLLVANSKAQLLTCTKPPPAGRVAGFTGGWCVYSAANIGNPPATTASACGAACLAVPACVGFVFYGGALPSCYLQPQIFASGLIQVASSTIVSTYMRSTCNVKNPTNGAASFCPNPNVDPKTCLNGLCTVTYTCNAGLALSGSPAATCGPNGVLSSSLPTCAPGPVYICPLPPPAGPVCGFSGGWCSPSSLVTIGNHTGLTVSGCGAACLANSQCVAFTYYETTASSVSNLCSLYNSLYIGELDQISKGTGSSYIRRSCTVQDPAGGKATYKANTNVDPEYACMNGLCTIAYTCAGPNHLVGMSTAMCGPGGLSSPPPTCNMGP